MKIFWVLLLLVPVVLSLSKDGTVNINAEELKVLTDGLTKVLKLDRAELADTPCRTRTSSASIGGPSFAELTRRYGPPDFLIAAEVTDAYIPSQRKGNKLSKSAGKTAGNKVTAGKQPVRGNRLDISKSDENNVENPIIPQSSEKYFDVNEDFPVDD